MKTGEIICNESLGNNYFLVKFFAPEICARARAGQFVHVRINHRYDRILRRPFSIHNTDPDGTLSIVYKVVGNGTLELSQLPAGSTCDLLGPLGIGFSNAPVDTIPVIVAGGYGAAATFMLTKQISQRGIFLIGARSQADVLLTDAYGKAGYEIRISTDDGSVGIKGRVTALVETLLAERMGKNFFFFGCGPHSMLMALARMLTSAGQPGEISIDHLMCCGIGACFACVVKVKANTPEGWQYARACADGPVFKLENVYTE